MAEEVGAWEGVEGWEVESGDEGCHVGGFVGVLWAILVEGELENLSFVG